MTTIQWTPDSDLQRAGASFQVLAARVVAAPASESQAAAEWLEDAPAEHWQPVRVEWGANGRPSALTLRRLLGVGPGKPRRDRPEQPTFQAGDRIRLVEGTRGGSEQEWFRGYVAQERLLIQSAPDAEVCEVVAYGPEILLKGKAVSGQWHARPDVDEAVLRGCFSDGELVRENTFRSHLPVVFNEAGQSNASPSLVGGRDAAWRLDARGEAKVPRSRTFDGPGRRVLTDALTYQAEPWRTGCAVQSLIEVVDGYDVLSPESADALPAELFDSVLGEVSVEGLDLLEALRAVLLPAGYGFAVEPWARGDGRHVLRVFRLHGSLEESRIRKPYMAPVDPGPVSVGDPDACRAEVQRIEFIRDNHNVANDVTVIGDQKRRQIVLAFTGADSLLRPAWDTALHDLADWATEDLVDPMQWPVEGQGGGKVSDFDAAYAYGGAGQVLHRHVFRSFTWNEDGAFCNVIEPLGDLGACSAADGAGYVRRPRPVGPTFLRDDADAKARNFPPFVQLGIAEDDQSWIQVPAVIWRDRAGFTIPVDPLWGWYPYATEYARHVPTVGETLFEKYGHLNYLMLLHNALRGSGTRLVLRLVGSVECDEAVTGRAGRRLESSWPMAAARVIRAESRFRCREVPGGSDPFAAGAGRYDVRDDSREASDFAAAVRDVLEDEVGHGSITLRGLTRAYAPGDVIPRTEGRAIDLTVRSGGGSCAPVVAGVVWDFGGIRKTELLLDTSLLRMAQ